MYITIQNTNLYVYNKNPLGTLRTVWSRILPWIVDSVGIQEGGEATDALRKLFYYRPRVNKGNRHESNNPILIRRSHKVLFKNYIPAVAGTGKKLSPPRNIFVVGYTKRGRRIVHINTHFHVVPEDRLAGVDEEDYNRVVNQYKRHVELLFRTMENYRDKGYIVFVTADGNTRPFAGKQDWEYAAYNYLNQKGFKVHRHGVDLIVTDTRRVDSVQLKTVSRAVLGDADHDTMVLRCKTK